MDYKLVCALYCEYNGIVGQQSSLLEIAKEHLKVAPEHAELAMILETRTTCVWRAND